MIERLHDLVSAPSRYDEFMSVLEERLDSIVDRHAEEPKRPTALVKHLSRAAELLDVVSLQRRAFLAMTESRGKESKPLISRIFRC